LSWLIVASSHVSSENDVGRCCVFRRENCGVVGVQWTVPGGKFQDQVVLWVTNKFLEVKLLMVICVKLLFRGRLWVTRAQTAVLLNLADDDSNSDEVLLVLDDEDVVVFAAQSGDDTFVPVPNKRRTFRPVGWGDRKHNKTC
jgi:hypothetical protein